MLDSQISREKILTDRRVQDLPPVAELVKAAAAREGIGAGRIFSEMIKLAMRRKGLTQHEYFANHLYRSDLTMEQKREFIGSAGSYDLNLKLAPPELTQMRGFLNDKLTHSALWQHWGLPTTVTQAMFTRDRFTGPAIEALTDAETITDFLTARARFPLFGKPVDGLQALGSVWIEGVDANTGTARLADGRLVAVSALADEIMRDFPAGYLFQDAVTQHPEVSDILGPMLSCPRLVTVVTDDTPEMFYAYWKIASPTAMSDNFWQEGSMLARINAKSGVVENCILGKGPDVKDVKAHPVSGKAIVGYQIPHWQEAVDLVRRAHAIFPVNGCLGWDVAFGPEGPLLIECNNNTSHDTYQLVLGQGIMAPEFKAVFDRVIARNDRIIADKKARVYKVKH